MSARTYIISDASIKRAGATNILNETYLYGGKGWHVKYKNAHHYESLSAAEKIANKLYKESPVKILGINQSGKRISVKNMNFTPKPVPTTEKADNEQKSVDSPEE